MAKDEQHGIINRLFTLIIRVVAVLALMYGLFGTGYLVVTTPYATTAIGHNFAEWDTSTFPEEDMAALAEAVRSYSIEGTPRTDLLETVQSVIEKSHPELDVTVEQDQLTISYGGLLSGLNESMQNMSGSLGENLTFPLDALQHLEDCTPLFQAGRWSVAIAWGVGLIAVLLLLPLRGRRSAGRMMIAASLLVMAIIVGLGIWAIADFNTLFTMFHQVAFPQGNWTFPAQSLLIQLFPEAFWMAMVILWAVISFIASVIVLLIGIIVK